VLDGVEERIDHLGELPVFWRRADGPCPTAVHLHGMPTSSDDWLPLLAAHGGVAPDLPGFGRSGKPGHFPYSPDGYAGFLDEFLDLAGLHGAIDLVAHDWGAVALAWAGRHPERVRRLVLIAPAPLLPGMPWPRLSRWLARPVVGELAMGAAIRPVFSRGLRRAAAGPLPDGFVAHAWRCFDPGTQRAVLRLHRSLDPAARAAMAAALARLERPALVASGANDPLTSPAVSRSWGEQTPGAAFEVVPDAGHWPWLGETSFVERVSLFLAGGMNRPG
jgi:pimeloyl-ACP methyl ester carboxylesterase